jgi:NAD(P)-dependent dehydrogenase (short-subunit alcohol dehydrogenase family)
MRGLKNRVAIVTGATNGIGAAIARRLGGEGCKVVVTGRNAERGAKVVTAIESNGGTAIWLAADLTIEEQVEGLMREAVDKYGAIQILVNNAAPVDQVATGSDNKCHLLETDDLRNLFAAGVYGVFWCCKYALPHMARESRGAIVNLSSVAAELGHDAVCGYTMLKGAVNTLTMSLAYDYAPNIRTNTVVVANARGTTTVDALLQLGGDAAAALRRSSLTAIGTVWDVASAVAFLASEESANVTGSKIYVDGGKTMKADSATGDAFSEGIAAYRV